ncbi:MAG: Dabb family protein [Opitutales bacterium]
MLNHTVIFWLKKELSDQDKKIFHHELEKLGMIESVHQLYIGSPASTTNRPVIDNSYDYCLTVILEDISAHDIYQQDPIHLKFIENCAHMWDKVKIYDAD